MGSFELDNNRNSILCSAHSFSISPHFRIYILFNIKSRFHIYENRGLNFAQYIPPRRGEGDSGTVRNSLENSTESQFQLKG